MHWSARRLRWLLLGGVAGLSLVVAGFFGVARYRAGQIWQRILARNGVHIARDTNGFTYSQSSKGRTIFTLHASRATPLGKNRWILHDAMLILYGREPGRDDRISGKEIEYDQEAGVARAHGEVHMDLQAPEPAGRQARPNAGPGITFQQDEVSGPAVIHVLTSNVVYIRKLELAATGENVAFRYGGVTCTSRGAEFDSGQSMLRLLADVHLTGDLHGKGYTLDAGRAELSRADNTVNLNQPVMTSGEQMARADHLSLQLNKDGSVRTAHGTGAVQLHRGTRTVSAPDAVASFAADNRPEHARLSAGVQFIDSGQGQPAQGSADSVFMQWAATGLLDTVLADGTVRFRADAPAAAGGTMRRTLAADHLRALLVPVGGGSQRTTLRHLDLNGHGDVTASGQGPGPRQPLVRVRGDSLAAEFLPPAEAHPLVKTLNGTGATQLDRIALDGSQQHSSGNTLSTLR